jgi:hypothetical protein
MSSSASNWIELGISMPSALAVSRLMTNSNLVDCNTGILHPHVLALDIARFVEALTERGKTARIGRSGIHEADHRHRWLLRACRERPRRRAAE